MNTPRMKHGINPDLFQRPKCENSQAFWKCIKPHPTRPTGGGIRRFLSLFLVVLLASLADAQEAPPLPVANGKVTLRVQDAPDQPARDLILTVFYPGGKRTNITARTGLMLDLHNWGGVDAEGAPSPNFLADTYDVVAICVRYYQSGDQPTNAIPYDFGYRQAWDALRGLHYFYQGLHDAKIPFDATRIYGTGGSGGGNVIQMANKFAPRTFACIVDLSGMASLTDDIAYNLPGGSGLNARYSRDPASPAYLPQDLQEIRDLGHPGHLAEMARLGNRCKIVVVHGETDGHCLVADKQRVVSAMQAAGLDVLPHYIRLSDVDGNLVKNSGHSLGDRTALLHHFAGNFLTPDSTQMCRLAGPEDFLRREPIVYTTSHGRIRMDYASGAPQLSAKIETPPPVPPAKPTAETLYDEFIPVWPPRFPAGYNERETAAGSLVTTSVPGQVTGLRFYKFAGSTHTLWLYDQDADPPALLATLTFNSADETAAGWQQKALTTPVPIRPGGHYMVWRSCPAGEKHGWTNKGKALHGSNGRHLTGGGFFRARVENDKVIQESRDYPADSVDADIVFLAD